MRGFAVRHAVFGAVRLDHVAVIAGAAVAGVLHALAVFAFGLVLADGGLLAAILVLLVAGIVRIVTIVLGIILIGGGIAEIGFQGPDKPARDLGKSCLIIQ